VRAVRDPDMRLHPWQVVEKVFVYGLFKNARGCEAWGIMRNEAYFSVSRGDE